MFVDFFFPLQSAALPITLFRLAQMLKNEIDEPIGLLYVLWTARRACPAPFKLVSSLVSSFFIDEKYFFL